MSRFIPKGQQDNFNNTPATGGGSGAEDRLISVTMPTTRDRLIPDKLAS